VSALAAMFHPPRVVHVPSRLVVSGQDVRFKRDIPPMPDADDRDAVKRKMNSLKHKRWYAKNKEYVAQKGREWNAANPEKRKQISKNWEINNPEKTKEKNRKAQAALRERKRNAKRNQERREHEQTAQTIPAPQAKGNGRTGATAHTKRVQTTSNDARSISAASV